MARYDHETTDIDEVLSCHDPNDDCPANAAHRGMRSKEMGEGGYMLVCADCGAEIRLANPLSIREQIAKCRLEQMA